ncbi:MAG TPA: M67 family metallopeptidase [Nitrosopumilaceae archaeon]|nr:M67 family metallopeptidase [Nitrosopumilaceae archaeon]
MEKSIVISQDQKDLLLNHALKVKPNESCAILFGSIEDEKNIVKDVFLAENIDESPVNFSISNEELLKAYKIAEEKNLDIVGIFHSHPSSDAFPSSTDKKFMHTNPVVWLISGESDALKAFVLEPEIIEIPIIIS